MMTETRSRRMTVEETGLLLTLVRWLKENGASHAGWAAQIRLPDGRTIAWETYGAMHWPRCGEVGVHPGKHRPLTWHEVESVTQGIDVLVSLGYLPARFSTVYQAGYSAGYSVCVDEMQSPSTIRDDRVPAMEPTW